MMAAFLAVLALSSLDFCASARPNIVFIFTDDLDVEMGSSSREYMPTLHSLIGDVGVSFSNFYTSTPVCCPSRSALYTGLYQHNNHVVGNELPSNCSSADWQNGPEKTAFSTLLQAGGYETFFSGKYLNSYGNPSVGGAQHVPPGWSDWQALLGNSIYYNYTMSNNGVPEVHGDSDADYLPSVVLNKTTAFIERVVASGGSSRTTPLANRGGSVGGDEGETAAPPFFAYLSLPSCHGPQEAAPQYRNLYPNARAPRYPNYNYTVSNAHWLQAVQGDYGLDDNSAAFSDLVYRRRLQTLASVDDIIASVVGTLQRLQLLDNTYIFFSSDNGYHTGTFGLIYDKRQPWMTDTHIPLFVRGPGVIAGQNITALATVPDITATFVDIATSSVPSTYDGISLLPYLTSPLGQAEERKMNLIEYHGESDGGGSGPACARTVGSSLFCNSDGVYALPPFFNGTEVCVCQDSTNNTYSCLRAYDTGAGLNYRYCEFADDVSRIEYFDYVTDPWELVNLAPSGGVAPTRLEALHAALAQAITCKGAAACNEILNQSI